MNALWGRVLLTERLRLERSSSASCWMARGGAGRAVALGLVLRLLFGLRTGLEAAPAPAHTRVQVSDTDTEIDKIFQEENATTTRISTTMENETSFRNVTFTSAGDSSRNPSAYGVIAAAA